MSRHICGCCLETWFRGLFAEPLSTVYNSDVAKSSFFDWLHLELHLQGAGLTWSLKNPNRSYRDVAASDVMLPVDAAAVCLLEVVLELMHIRYPLS